MAPTILFVSLFAASLLRFLGYGPLTYQLHQYSRDTCGPNWWKDPIFINNYIIGDHEIMKCLIVWTTVGTLLSTCNYYSSYCLWYYSLVSTIGEQVVVILGYIAAICLGNVWCWACTLITTGPMTSRGVNTQQ
ncbi:hypothetical protein Pmani_031678 [Petrolisthes manimaculis]|uniref:Uncharacterized protein n=1 Tax=Petrolisthes manimaculis TaxID=1843537 RepID=A0AAE1TSE8_9EUCA|nr:hypothetical protein Pmani_031678 [Petrolisthes manimaculis]